MSKVKRSILNIEGLNSQISTTTQAFEETENKVKVQLPMVEKKGQGRPPVKPPCTKVTMELPDELLERLRLAAIDMTRGNRTLLIEQILLKSPELKKYKL